MFPSYSKRLMPLMPLFLASRTKLLVLVVLVFYACSTHAVLSLDEYALLLENTVTGSIFEDQPIHGISPWKSSHLRKNVELLVTDKDERNNGNDWPVFGHTMVGHLRIQNIRLAIETVFKDDIEGDFVETGVWRGGSCIYARGLMNFLGGRDRIVHMFDLFDKLEGAGNYGSAENYLSVSQELVKGAFAKYGMSTENVRFHKGYFKDTVPSFGKAALHKIAILRVDGNFYDSYQDAMYSLYELVPVGGFVIFDDVMSHPHVMKFWTDFKREQGLPEELITIDLHSAYWRKTTAITLNRAFFRPPQDANMIRPVGAPVGMWSAIRNMIGFA